ncbi:MAG: hypothetical protein AAFR13_00080 [Pseudomonadota bacterium]
MTKSRFCKTKRPEKRIAIFTAIAALTALSACTTNPEPAGGSLSADVQGKTAVAALQRVNEAGLRCWIRSGDDQFDGLALVPELDTRTGDPRILVVRRGQSQGLPQLVITASGGDPVNVTTFGPLVSAPVSERINSDILAWTAGRSACT